MVLENQLDLNLEEIPYVSLAQFEILKKKKKLGQIPLLTTPLWLTARMAKELGYNAGEEDFLLEPLAPEPGAIYGRLPQPTVTTPPFTPTEMPTAGAPAVTPIIPQPTAEPPLQPPEISLTGDYGLLYQDYLRTGGTLDVVSWGAAGAPLRPDMETEPTDEELSRFLKDLTSAGQIGDVEGILRYLGLTEEQIDEIVGIEVRQQELEGLVAKVFPQYQYDLEGFVNLVKTDWEGFITQMRAGGLTKEKASLLEMIGIPFSDVFPSITAPRQPQPLDIRAVLKQGGVSGVEIEKIIALSTLDLDSERWLAKWKNINPSTYKNITYSLFGRSLAAGIGGILAAGAGVAGWAKQETLQDNLLQIAQVLQSNAPPQEPYKPFLQSIIDPRFWQTTVARALPFSLAIMPVAITTAYAGAVSAGAIGLGAFGTYLMTTIYGAAGASIIESTLEAGGTYNEAKGKGFSDEEATQAANSVFIKNIGLLTSTNAVELFAAFLPAPTRTLNNLIARGLVRTAVVGGRLTVTGLSEGGQEMVQEAFQRQALGEKVEWNDEMKMAGMLGGIMGIGLGGAGEAFTTMQSRVKARLTPEQTVTFNADVASFMAEGLAEPVAEIRAFDNLAKTVEGQSIIEEVVEQVTQEETIKMVKPVDKVEALAWEHLAEQGREVAPAVPEKVTPAPEVTAGTHLNLGRTQGNRLILEEAGILTPGRSQLTISEIVTKLDEIQAKLDKIPTSRSGGPQFRKIDNARVTLLRVAERESGLSETGLRNIAEGLPPPKVPLAIPKAVPEKVIPAPEVTRIEPTYENLTEGQTLVDQAGERRTITAINKKGVPARWGYTTKEEKTGFIRTRPLGEIERYEKIEQPAIPKAEAVPEAGKYPATLAGAEARAKAEGISIAEASRLNAEQALKAPAARPEPAGRVAEVPVEEVPLSESLQAAYDEIRVLRQQRADTEKVKASLVKLIRKHLPLPRQGEWLAKVKNVKTEADLAEAIARVQEVAEANVEKLLRADIIKELSRTKPRVERGVTVGRLSPEVQPVIEKLRASLLVGIKGEGGITRNVEAYEEARARIEQGISDYRDGKITWEALLEANEELKYTGLYGMSTAQLQETLDYIQELKRLGKDLRKIKRETIKEQREGVVDKAVTEITGGEGIKPGVGTLRGKDLAGIKKVLEQPVNSQYGFVNLLDKLGKFAKGTKQYQGFLMRFANLTQRAVNTENMEREQTFKLVRDKFRAIYNVKKTREATRLLATLSNEDVDLGTFRITTKEGVKYLPIKLTKAEMMEAYQLYKNPKNLETFKEGMHWTPEMITKIVNTLTEQDITWADWLQNEFYTNYYDKINPFYQQEFNIDMPKNPDYVPQSRNFEAEANELDEVLMLVKDQKRYASVTNKSLKARQENIRPFQFKGVFTVLTNHIVQMEHFMAWAETMHELRSTFGNKEVRTAIQQYHSNDIVRRLDDYMNDFARGGVDRVQFLNILDKLRSNFAVSVLALKPSIGLQQIWTVGAFMTEMKVKDFVTGMTSFWKNPIANYQWMMGNSTYLKNRYQGGNYERDIRLAQQQGVVKTMSGAGNISQWLLWQVTQGDKFGVMPGWWAKYQSGLKAGLNQTDAMTAADLASERTQNTSELASLSWLQRGSSFGKLLTMFQSQPNKYFRIIADNIRNMQYGRQSKVKGITNLFIIWIILPMLFQWVADAFKFEKEKQARILLLGPLNNILVVGQLIQTAWGWFTDDSFEWQASPVLSTGRDFQNFSSKLKKIIGQIKDPYKDVVMDDIISAIEFLVKGIGQLTGAPTPYLIMVERAIRDGDPRELVFSRWALEKPTPDLQSKTAKIVGQYGQVIEDVTDLPVDKKPSVYDTKKGFSEVKESLSKTLPQDVTEKNGFSPQVVAIAQAIMAQDILETIPNKRLFEIIDGILGDNTLNYTFSQYYMDYQDRQKITSLAKLKEWDDEHPRFNLGNVTPAQFALMRQYEALETKAEKMQFRKDHPEIDVNPRIEWLKKNPEQNALLALHGQADILTKEAYNQFKAMIKELDIPDSAIPVSEIWGEKVTTLPSDALVNANFERGNIVEEFGANSWEDKLHRAKNPELNEWLGLGDIDTPIAALELKTEKTYRETYLKLEDKDYLKTLDDKDKDENGLTAKDRYIAELKTTKIGDMTYIDIDRKIKAIEKGTDETPIPDEIVNAYVSHYQIVDKTSGNSAEAKLNRYDNPGLNDFMMSEAHWGKDKAEPLDEDKSYLDNYLVPRWRIDVKYRKEDAEYQAILDKFEGREESEQAKAYMDAHEVYRKDDRRRKAYGLTNSKTGYKFPTSEVENYVAYNELPIKGKRRDRFLVENSKFAKALYDAGEIADLPDPTKVPAVQYDDIYDQFPDQFDEIENNGKPESEWFEPDEERRGTRDKELRFDPTGKLTEFGLAETRRQAYGLFVPEHFVEDYVGYYTIVKEGKPADYPDDMPYWEDDWWMMEHPDFYEVVYLGILGKQRKDYRKVPPSRELGAKYLIYDSLLPGRQRKEYRRQNLDLDAWGQAAFGWKSILER